MNEVTSKNSMRVRTISPVGSGTSGSKQGRQVLQQGGKDLPDETEQEEGLTDKRLEEALIRLQQQASKAGIELTYKLEEDVFGEVVTLIDIAENKVVRRIPVAELLQQMDRQLRQSSQRDGNGLIINGIA